MRLDARVLFLVCALACAGPGGEATTAVAPAAAAVADSPEDSASLTAQPLLAAAAGSVAAASTFPHSPHRQFECARCHASVAGHQRHGGVGCRDCHEPPAATNQPARTCASCHHAGSQAYGCLHCHDGKGAPAAARAVSLRLHVAGVAVERDVAFPHGRHATVSCTRCHASESEAPMAAACAECHAKQHSAQSNCAACHSPPRRGVHDAAVHQGCGGTGCHTNTAVLALPHTAALCLSCHRDRIAHEPGGDCAGCHKLRTHRPATEADR